MSLFVSQPLRIKNSVLAVIFASIVVGYAYEYDSQRNSVAPSSATPSQSIKECPVSADFVSDTLCLIKAASRQQDQNRQQADLRAQQDMAIWTQGMFWVGVLATFISIGGIALVYTTLIETRRMTIATREIGERQTAAYVFVPSVKIDEAYSEDGENAGVLRFTATIENVGQSPGIRLSYKAWLEVAGITYTNPVKVGHDTTTAFDAPNVPPNKKEEMGFNIYSIRQAIAEYQRRESLQSEGQTAFDKIQFFFLRVDIFYEDISGNRFVSEYRGWLYRPPFEEDIGKDVIADYDSNLRLFFKIEDLPKGEQNQQ